MKLVRPGIVVASIALAIVAPLSASAAASGSHIQPTDGTITGTVTGAGSAPVVGACIALYSSGQPFAGSAMTNAQGVYVLAGVLPNQSDPYEIAVNPGCGRSGPNANYMAYISSDFNVVAGQTTTVNATLTLGGSITGRVLLGGVPTSGVCVEAAGVSDAASAETVSVVADGTYVLSGMTPDTYKVHFQVCGIPQPNIQPVFYGAHADGSGSSVTVGVGQQLALGDQAVQLGGEVDIKLTDGGGHPLTTNVYPILRVTDPSYAGIQVGAQYGAPDGNGYWHTYGLLSKSYEIDYYYCTTGCRAGPIGSYAGHGVGGTPTPVTPVAGGAPLMLTDAVSIPADSTTSSVVTFSPAAPTAGQTIAFKATITDPQTGTVPTGQVDFQSDAGDLGSAPLNSHGIAILNSNTLLAGVHHVYSSYDGDGDSEASSSPSVTVTVAAAASGGTGGSSGTAGGGGGGATAPVGTPAPVTRVSGTDRIATAVAVSQNSFPTGNAGAVVLARADDYPDALVGGPLAAAKNAPLLLTEGSTLPSETATEVKRVLPAGGTVYVLGGTSAIPTSVTSQLTSLGYTVTRYSGADRYATAVAVATALGSPTTVLLATGTNFPDALAAGPAAAHVHGAILLTDGSTVPAETATYLAGAHTTYAIGGPAAAAVPSATAIVGGDRYATAAAVATKFFPTSTVVGVATGTGFPDALAGGAQLALMGGPLLLSSATTVPTSTSTYLTADHSALTKIYVYGGTSVLSANVVTELAAAFGG
jgi:hypothetical protein